MSAIISKNINGELEAVLEEFRTNGSVNARPLSVGGIQPFRGRGRGGLSVGAALPGGNATPGAPAPSWSGPGACSSGPEAIKRYLDRIGYPPCRIWGAEPPAGRDALGCPSHKKLCIIPYPVRLSVAQSSTVTLTVKAKLWFWPLMVVDAGSGTSITVDDMTYTGDPVLENGELDASTGTPGRGWSPSASFPPEGNYSILPGMPAIDTSSGLVLTITNANGAAAESLAINFMGVSIRN